MPCRDEGRMPSEYEDGSIQVMRQLACDYCRSLEATQAPIPEWAKAWWEKHKEQDRQRLEHNARVERKGRLRTQALEKLTAEEKDALGL